MLKELIRVANRPSDSPYTQLMPGLGLSRYPAPSTFDCMMYEPLVCLILQGSKETIVGDHQATVSAGESILVSHAMPVMARVRTASRRVPYLGLVATLDLAELRSLYDMVDDRADEEGEAPRGFSVAAAPKELLDLFGRYLALVDRPDDARVLLPLVRRELHYRLLMGPSGRMLRMLLRRDSHASSVWRAVEMLRKDYRRRVEMDDLARTVGMSASSFYKHFKAVTSTTPLQYQKDLRLTEARRLVLGGEHTVSSAAHAVGYESPSQFSREYSRKFGTSPRADLPAHTMPEQRRGSGVRSAAPVG